MNSANHPTLRASVRLGERRASAIPRPTIAARIEPSTVARMVIFTPWIRVGRISQTKFQSHSIRAHNPSDTYSVEAACHAPFERAHAPGDDQRQHEINNENGSERHQRAAGPR